MDEKNQKIWRELKERNHKMFDSLFRKYYVSLVSFAEMFLFDRGMSEDVVQSFFLSLWENAPRLEAYGPFRPYCFRSVKNRCMNQLRDIKVSDKHELLYVEAVMRQADSPDTLIDPSLIDEVKENIERLPPVMARIFKLKYIERKKNADISQLMGISENSVKTQLSRARIKLRKMINFKKNYFFLY